MSLCADERGKWTPQTRHRAETAYNGKSITIYQQHEAKPPDQTLAGGPDSGAQVSVCGNKASARESKEHTSKGPASLRREQ